MQFQVTGRHEIPTYGHKLAHALAFTAVVSSLLTPEANLRFGCGLLKINMFHGDERDQFYVYDLEKFVSARDLYAFDLRCETFVPADEFCWNCTHIDDGDNYARYKCLGHTVDVDAPGPRELHYDDDTNGVSH